MIYKTLLFVLITSIGFLISCGNNSTGSDPEPEEINEPDEPAITTGTLEVTIVTEGETIDEDGYQLNVDGVDTKASEVDDTITFSEIEEGTYQLELTGMAANCSTEDNNPWEIDITAEETTSIDFGVSCQFALRDKIAFTSDRDDYPEIYTINSDGSNVEQYSDIQLGYFSADISRDGTQIAYDSYFGGSGYIYISNAADAFDAETVASSSGVPTDPGLSPDGTKLVYEDTRDSNREIFIANADGTGETRLTDNSSTDKYPKWSPNGDKIIFSSTRDGDYDIYTMNPDGSEVERITDDINDNSDPVWSPDGNKLAFVSDRDGNDEIYTMNIDGTDLVRLTYHSAKDNHPDWSPDGSEIVFQTDRDGDDEIYKISAHSSGGVTNLTNNPAADVMPSWSPFE